MGRRWVILIAVGCAVAALLVTSLAHQHRQASTVVPQNALRLGKIDFNKMPETSGMAASRRYPGVYWVHGDSGTEAAIYAVTREGWLIRKILVNARNVDWEDIATDDAGHLYLSDTGNNHGQRSTVRVLRVDEPNPDIDVPPLNVEESWELTFPGQPLNCESLLVYAGQGFLISRFGDGKAAQVYRFSLAPPKAPVQLEKFLTLPIKSAITAASLDPDDGRIAILSKDALLVYDVAGDVSRLATAKPFRVPLIPPHRLEACCFAPDGIIAAAETGEIYLLPSWPGRSR